MTMAIPPTSIKSRLTRDGDVKQRDTEHQLYFSGITGDQLIMLRWLELHCTPTIRMSLHDGELIAYEHYDMRVTEHYIQPDGTMESYIFDQASRDWRECDAEEVLGERNG